MAPSSIAYHGPADPTNLECPSNGERVLHHPPTGAVRHFLAVRLAVHLGNGVAAGERWQGRAGQLEAGPTSSLLETVEERRNRAGRARRALQACGVKRCPMTEATALGWDLSAVSVARCVTAVSTGKENAPSAMLVVGVQLRRSGVHSGHCNAVQCSAAQCSTVHCGEGAPQSVARARRQWQWESMLSRQGPPVSPNHRAPFSMLLFTLDFTSIHPLYHPPSFDLETSSRRARIPWPCLSNIPPPLALDRQRPKRQRGTRREHQRANIP